MISISHQGPLLSMNTFPQFNNSLQDECITDLLSSAPEMMIDPLPLHPKSMSSLPKTSSELEPRPIHPKQVSLSDLKAPSLPESIKQYCDEYIALLGPLAVQAPAKKSTKVERRNSGSSESETSSTNGIGYHAFQNERWMDRFQELVEFYQREGHFNVPYKSNTTLFQWVKRQRHQFKLRSMGEHSNLTLDRIHQLDQIGFVWNSHLAAWNDKFKELKDFKMIQGHCFVPCTYNGSSKLSTWIKRQRRQYRKFMAGQQSTLDASRIEKLEKLGLVWDYYAGKDKDGTASSDEE
ncbi:unnamed protein product [Cylindrotheca closterium]|uniref:Helicase-associated domain-containing protein n=1 Tax=Cylindrotheca closterium TaxID=2856 RepID=A0AAD2CUS6_9STRA|nr:unnamed protein product [Cylindrotheca closterium]